MLLPPIEIIRNYDKAGEMLPHVRQKFLARGWTEEKIARAEERAKEILAEVEEERAKFKERSIARSGLTISEQLSEGHITLEDLI